MYDISKIVKSFSTLVGWRDTNLSNTESGLFFQEAHPLLTLRALSGVMPKDLIARLPAFVSGSTYEKGAMVSDDSKGYLSLADDNTAALSDTDKWVEIDNLEVYLSRLTEGGIKKVVTRFVNEKMVGLETKNLVDRRTLFDGAGRKEARTENKGRLVGFEITPVRSFGITTTINKVGIQMYGNTGTVKLYLFHSSVVEPIATKEVQITSDKGSFAWFDLSWTLPYISENTNAGGSWYIVYNQAALPDYMESINFGRDWSREPCGTCNKGNLQLYRLMQRFITLSPFYVALSNWNEELWDLNDNIYTPQDNYGLNFMFTIACDVTDTLIAERSQFANAIQLQVASDALREVAMNPEVAVNRVQMNAERDAIMYEVSGNGQGIKGLQGELDRAFKALSVDLKGLDPICMGCHNKGVRYTSI